MLCCASLSTLHAPNVYVSEDSVTSSRLNESLTQVSGGAGERGGLGRWDQKGRG